MFEVLARDVVVRERITLGEVRPLDAQLSVTPFPVPGKVPLYLEDGDGIPSMVEDGTTVGVELTDGRARMLYIPGCAAMSDTLRAPLQGADMVFFDGTLWRDDEMVAAGLSKKIGRRMGHTSLSGQGGTIEAFRTIDVGQKIIIHMNNSNPVLLADSPERAVAEAAGWIVAQDGLEFEL